jgi:mannose-6-phosphate isomerase-like protein (cupin superfamily)
MDADLPERTAARRLSAALATNAFDIHTDTTMTERWLVTTHDAADARSAMTETERARYLVRHGTMRLGVYAPVDQDPQGPHMQDEVYVVIAGTGIFVKGDERQAFGPGDAIVVEAGVVHRFESFSADFSTWVLFWGPDGGEAPTIR